MKGKTNTGVTISETESLIAGTEVEIVDTLYDREVYHACLLPDGRRISINASNIDIKDYTQSVDWGVIRREFASRAMQGMLSNDYNGLMNYPKEYEFVAKESVKYADALIKELKSDH